MPNNTRRIFVFAFVIVASAVSSMSKDEAITPDTLITQARKLQDIWTDGTSPVVMRAEIQAFDAKGAPVPGQYLVNWISPFRWREQLRLANYERLRVHDAKGYWQKSVMNFQPEIIFQLDTLLDFKSVLQIGAKQTLSKVKSHEKDGVRQRCTEVKWAMGTDRILCFDEASGNLLSVEYPTLANENPPDISRIEYSAFNNVGEKRVPFEIRAFRDRKVVASVKVLEITSVTEQNSALFVAPTNSEFWTQCDDIQKAELVDRVQPKYPPDARSSREQGRVIFYAVIEADGSLSHLTTIQRASASLESAAADAVRQWHYKPAACGSTPIRMETSISTDFWLQH